MKKSPIRSDAYFPEWKPAFTQHLNPLCSTTVGIQYEHDYPEISSEFIISEIDVYHKLSTSLNF